MDLRQWLEKLKTLDPKYLLPLLVAAALGVVVLDVLFMARPQWGAIAALSAKTVQVRTDIDLLTVNTQRMAQFRENLDKARRQMKDFKAMVHTQDGVPAVLREISTVGNEYGVKIDQLVPQKADGAALVTNEDGKYKSLSILIRARAGYHDLGRFLNRLIQEHVFWQLETVDVMADDRDRARHTVKLQMKILVLGE